MLAAILLLAPAVLGAPQFGYGYGGYGGYGGVYSPQYRLPFGGLGEAELRRRYSAPLSMEESEESSEEGSDYNEDEDSSSEEDDSGEPGGPPPALGRLTIREPDPGFPPSQPPAGAPPPDSAEDIPPPPPSNKILLLEEPTSEFDFKTSQVAWACKEGKRSIYPICIYLAELNFSISFSF